MPVPMPQPPGPKCRALVHSLLMIKRDRLAFVLDAGKRYGDIVGFGMGRRKVFLLRHPEHIRYVLSENPANFRKGLGIEEARPLLGYGLLSSDGEIWTRQRRLLQAAFHADRLDSYRKIIVAAAEKMASRWRTDTTIDAAHEMTLLTVSIVGQTLLGIDLDSQAEGIARDLHTLTADAMARMSSIVPIPRRVPTPANLRAARALRRMETRVNRMIDERRSHPTGGGDMLSLLVETQDANGGRQQVRDELMTALVAGHETTAAALSWAWRLLSQHPEISERLREELETVLGGEEPTMATQPRLVYTKAVIEETIRLYPPVWLLPRKNIEADTIGSFHVPPQSEVLLCLYSMHRHPAFWDEPDRFMPERFLREKNARHFAAYLPFGAGPRTCIGSRLGLMEATLILAVLARRFRAEAIPGIAVQAEASLSLHARNGVPVIIRQVAPARAAFACR